MAKFTPNQQILVNLIKKYTGKQNVTRTDLPKRTTKKIIADFEKYYKINIPNRGENLMRQFNSWITRFRGYPFGYYFTQWWNTVLAGYNRAQIIQALALAEQNGMIIDDTKYYDSDIEKMQNEVDYIAENVERYLNQLGDFDFGSLGNYGGADETEL